MQERCFASKSVSLMCPRRRGKVSLSRKPRAWVQTPAAAAAARDTQGVQTADDQPEASKAQLSARWSPGMCVRVFVCVCVCLTHTLAPHESYCWVRRDPAGQTSVGKGPAPLRGSEGKGRRTFYFFTCFRHTPPGEKNFWSAGLSAGEAFEEGEGCLLVCALQ